MFLPPLLFRSLAKSKRQSRGPVRARAQMPASSEPDSRGRPPRQLPSPDRRICAWRFDPLEVIEGDPVVEFQIVIEPGFNRGPCSKLSLWPDAKNSRSQDVGARVPKTFQIGHRLSLIQSFALLGHLGKTRKLHTLPRKTSLDFRFRNIAVVHRPARLPPSTSIRPWRTNSGRAGVNFPSAYANGSIMILLAIDATTDRRSRGKC